jgi:hypothetical protein
VKVEMKIEEPLPFPSDAFRDAWNIWEQSRREGGKPIKPTARKLQLTKCLEWGETRSISALKHSASNGYQGLFEPNDNKNGTGKNTLEAAKQHVAGAAEILAQMRSSEQPYTF